ncbi:protein of unknown function [Pararobbsia alpina]
MLWSSRPESNQWTIRSVCGVMRDMPVGNPLKRLSVSQPRRRVNDPNVICICPCGAGGLAARPPMTVSHALRTVHAVSRQIAARERREGGALSTFGYMHSLFCRLAHVMTSASIRFDMTFLLACRSTETYQRCSE